VKKSGNYFVRVAAASEPIAKLADGGRYSSYRLVAGAVPHMLHALPAGARRGATNELRIAGLNLQKVDRVVLGELLAEGKIVQAGAGSITVRMAVSASVAPGTYPLRFRRLTRSTATDSNRGLRSRGKGRNSRAFPSEFAKHHIPGGAERRVRSW